MTKAFLLLGSVTLIAEGALFMFGEISWEIALERYGIPTLFLCGILYGLWKAAKWLGPNILTPMKDTTIKFILTTQENVTQQTKTLEELRDLHIDIKGELKAQTVVLEKTSQELQEVHGRVLQIPVPENVIIHTGSKHGDGAGGR